MKILMLTTEFPPAKGYGLARYNFELAVALAQLNVEVHVVSMNLLEGKANYQVQGITVHLLKEQLGFKSFHWVSDTVINNIVLLERSIEVMEEIKPNFLIAHNWLSALTAKSLKTIYQIPLVLTIHDTEVGKRNNKLTREQCYIAETEGWISGIADKIVTNSSFMKEEIHKTYKVAKQQISVIAPGVNPDSFTTKTNLADFRRFLAPDHEKIVLFVGRLSHVKGPEILLKAAPKILKKFPNTTFVIAGEGILQPKLIKEAEAIGKFLFVGHLQGKALTCTYKVAQCLVMPSIYEPFGLVALEAFVCELPVIASNVGGLSEIIEHNKTGLQIPPHDDFALAKSVIEVLSNTLLAKSLSKNALQKSQEFSWKKTAQSFKDLYQSIVR